MLIVVLLVFFSLPESLCLYVLFFYSALYITLNYIDTVLTLTDTVIPPTLVSDRSFSILV